jgi:hypothetical protein
LVCFYADKDEGSGGIKVEGVGAMKVKEFKLEEIESPHTSWSGRRLCTGKRGDVFYFYYSG